MKRRRKTIIAGPLVKIVEYTPPLPRDNQKTRRIRQKATKEARKLLNRSHAYARLEEKLATNFSSRDYFITFTYRNGEEPANRTEAKEHRAQYIRRLRDSRKRRGQPLCWIMAIENKHGAGRYHFHAVINAAGYASDMEEIESLWEHGHVHIERLFDAAHNCGDDFNSWLDVACYLTKERPEDGPDLTPNGAQIYSCSRNLKQPIVKTEWINDGDQIDIPEEAYGIEHHGSNNPFYMIEYYRYLTAPLACS